jgi:plasmid stability protein
MSKMVQIRDVPDDVHARLIARAASEGRSLSEMLREEVATLSRRPSRAEVLKRIRQRGPVEMPESGADAIRRLRDDS